MNPLGSVHLRCPRSTAAKTQADHLRFRTNPAALIAAAKKDGARKNRVPEIILNRMADPQPASSPRRSRGFSIKSDKSHRTNTSGHKSRLSESSEEKARRSLQTKADPLVAMNELQPSTSTSMFPSSSTWATRSQSVPIFRMSLTNYSGCRLGKVQFGLAARDAA